MGNFFAKKYRDEDEGFDINPQIYLDR